MSKNRKQMKIIKKLRAAEAKANSWYNQYVSLLAKNRELELAIDKLKHRLDVAGFTTPTLEESTGPVRVIEADIEPYGSYVALTEEPTERDMEILKKQLTQGLVDGLLANNLVQIIYKDPYNCGGPFGDVLNNYYTYAAKMYVVPWEQMRVFGRHVRLYEYLGGRVKDGRENGTND